MESNSYDVTIGTSNRATFGGPLPAFYRWPWWRRWWHAMGAA